MIKYFDNIDNYYLANLYYKKKNYNEMKHYYLLAINNGHIKSIIKLANYYYKIEKNYDEAKQYFILGLSLNSNSKKLFYKLGHYYQYIEHNYIKMEENYLLAINKGCVKAMYNLGVYYESIETDYKMYTLKKKLDNRSNPDKGDFSNYYKMHKYYSMAIEKGCVKSMNNLGDYYYYLDLKYESKCIEYYRMAADKGCIHAIYKLGCYYQNKHKDDYRDYYNYGTVFKNIYEKMKIYYLMAIKKGCIKSMFNLAMYYQTVEKNKTLMNKYYNMAYKELNLI